MSWLDLPSQVSSDPEWQRQFDRQRDAARGLARRVPLLHVSGKSLPFHLLFATTPPTLPTSDEAFDYYTDNTRKAEDALQLGRSVYFYAGHALPEFGQVALAFQSDVEREHTGSATPFDTGGWVARYLASRLRDGPPEEAHEFAKRVTIPLDRWRELFEHYLAAYFDPYDRYWGERPCRVDPEELFDASNGNDLRAWIVEVRFLEAQELEAVSAWCASPQEMEVLRRTTRRTSGVAPQVRSSLRRFIRDHPALRAGGDPDYCGVVMRWAREES
jgi:hypothetical protein